MANLHVHKHPNMVALFEHLYFVSVPEMYLRKEEDVRARGMTTTGDPDIDYTMQNSQARIYLCIDAIFELFRSGVDVQVINYDDTEKIYNAIQRHLTTWMNYLNHGVNLYGAPFDDLMDLDRYANIVYDKAKFVFTDDAITSIQHKWSSLGINLNPATFLMGHNSRPKFQHLMKNATEKMIESDTFQRTYLERGQMTEEIAKIASRYDLRPRDTQLKELRFANDK